MASFAHQVKNELVRNAPVNLCCARAELKAFLQMSGRLTVGTKTTSVVLQTQSPSVARRLFSLFKLCFNITAKILSGRKSHLQKNSTFVIQIPEKKEAFKVLQEFGFLASNSGDHHPFLMPHLKYQAGLRDLQKKCCRRSYLRGAFLASGSLNDPKTVYHLEIVAPYENYARTISEVMAAFNLEARYFQRKGDFVVYIKGAEEIGEFLRIINASNALLKFENIRIVKGVRNKINRLVNCETANLTKTVVASQEQISNIKLIEEMIGLKNIPPSLAQVAHLRLNFPEATLQELGEMVSPPLSKSSVNHRLRRINALAQKLKKEQGDSQ